MRLTPGRHGEEKIGKIFANPTGTVYSKESQMVSQEKNGGSSDREEAEKVFFAEERCSCGERMLCLRQKCEIFGLRKMTRP